MFYVNKKKENKYPINIIDAVKLDQVFLGEKFYINNFPATCVNINSSKYVFSMDQIFASASIAELESAVKTFFKELITTGKVMPTNFQLFSEDILSNIDFFFIPRKEQIFYYKEAPSHRFSLYNKMGVFSIIKGFYCDCLGNNGEPYSWLLFPEKEVNGNIIYYVASCYGTLKRIESLNQKSIGIPIFFQMTGGE